VNYTALALPKMKERTANTKKTTNKILAMSMAEPAMLVNPSTAAIIAITKNVAAQFNIMPSFLNKPLTSISTMNPVESGLCGCHIPVV